ncbi:MAG: hypothetical protein NTW01_08450 [Gammaproteobacteria bacterium]|nr:hypothetical protein [Gammaproteobacteria bacterium]
MAVIAEPESLLFVMNEGGLCRGRLLSLAHFVAVTSSFAPHKWYAIGMLTMHKEVSIASDAADLLLALLPLSLPDSA